jgi:NACalpha-BTF3-like transcription factor
MTTGHEPPSPGEGAITAEDVELAERRASKARERAAHAGLESEADLSLDQ